MTESRIVDCYGPCAVVTGASDGMGRAIAEQLAAAGLDLVLVARRAALLDALAAELRAKHEVEVRTLAIDLGRRADVERLIAETESTDVGLLVAAAGFGTSGPLVDGNIDDESDLVAVNCIAVLILAHAFGRRLAARGRGGMVLFGSLVGWQGAPYAANYAASKAYVQSLAQGLAAELGPGGVTVLSAAPGPVASGFSARAAMRMSGALCPDAAAREIVAALGRSGTVVPGFGGKFLTWSLKPLPRRLRVRIMGGVMKGMAAQHGSG